MRDGGVLLRVLRLRAQNQVARCGRLGLADQQAFVVGLAFAGGAQFLTSLLFS
jgi:hypothetical protein